MKSRIVVWTLVAIVVIVGMIVVLTAPKTSPSPRVSRETIETEAARAESQLDRLTARIAEQRKSGAPGTRNERLDEAEGLLAEARDKLGQAKQATDVKEAQQFLIDGSKSLRKARRTIQLAKRP
ncbi:hypothetical protein FJY68_09310 [candidate division WOR-3 bacterium]|uniref:DUF4398 domain-containing protein n=1 Tax=candidate division WOR-3 bacterium TaxID=2052148 RepID=A0A937XE39_UNCW3|nr:hypothetical protein [candidate division WOR-3 bacterium]